MAGSQSFIKIAVFSAVLAVTSTALAAEATAFWPQFHGPNRDNISTEKSLLKTWPENGPPLLWTTEGLGHGFSSLAIADGRIISAGNIGEETVVTAVDLDGEILWQVPNGKAWLTKPAYPGTRGTPTIDGDRVYHESPHGNVICLNAETGDKVWEVNIADSFNAPNIRWARAESLLIDGDNVICCPGGPEASVVALNKNTGEVVWQAPSTDEGPGYASPTLFEHQGMRIIATITAKSFIGVNADSGDLLFQEPHESYTDQNTLMPIFNDGRIFISTIRANTVQWDVIVNDGKVSLKENWRQEEFDNHHGGMLLINGNLYGVSTSKNRNKWVCLDWDTGAIKHVEPGVGKGSLTYADGMLYELSKDSLMGLVQPLPDGQKTVSTFQIPEGGEGNSWAHPVVTGGRLYIRHGTYLYAYDVSE